MSKVILHIDGDSFFASCEISLDPNLRGKPVVTGQERGIATAMSPEAKALGITRGMPVFQIKKNFPQVVVTQSHYGTYGIFAQRMYDIVRRYTTIVEEYSIDECFADLTSVLEPNRGLREAKLALAMEVKETLKRELGMTFSIGIGPTKVLAKIASKHQKPDGLTVIEENDIQTFLKDLPIGKVWGIGPQTTQDMQKRGINTALEFITLNHDHVQEAFARPNVDIYKELKGISIHEVNDHIDPDDYRSLQKTRTFTPPSSNRSFVLRELSKNVELACAKARRHNLSARRIYYFLKTQEFRYKRKEIALVNPLSNPNDILVEIEKTFDEVYVPNILYRATGVTLSELVDSDHVQTDLFGGSVRVDDWGKVYEVLDKVTTRYGSNSMMLGSSLKTRQSPKIRVFGGSAQNDEKHLNPINRNLKKRFRIPYLGEVK